MNRKLVALSGMPAVVAVALAVVLAGCTEAARTAQDVEFGTADLSVVLVPTLTEGMPMTAVTLPEATAGSDALTYSVTPEVPGLSFQAATRVLSGTPTTAGTSTLTYTATTSAGESASLMFTVEVVSSFHGTWRAHHEWWDDPGLIGTYTDTLTFTKSRYIHHRPHYRTGNASVDYEWARSGAWEYTDTHLTRTWMHNDDDDDESPDVLTSVKKSYLWNDDRTILCVQHWEDSREQLSSSPQCDRHERVTSPPPTFLFGVWRGTDDHNHDWSIVLNPTRFSATIERAEDDIFTLTGTYTIVQEELFILVTVDDALHNGESILDADKHWWKGQVSRWAFAPTDSPTKIVVSPHWEEHEWLDQEQKWVDHPEFPHGDYRLTMEKE